jgi:hypothetical protein
VTGLADFGPNVTSKRAARAIPAFMGEWSGESHRPQSPRNSMVLAMGASDTLNKTEDFRCAKVQSVEPDTEYRFKGVGRLIGNAVPVRLGTAIGKSIAKHLSEYED